MSIEDLLRYGAWSGPGWTAGLPADYFDNRGVARTLSDDDLETDGIDRYDNFVAKAHDINEYQAQAALRNALGTLGLIDNTVVTLPNGRPGYGERLVYGGGGRDLKRFASVFHYADLLAQRGGDAAARAQLGRAFTFYYLHLIYSNLQFAIDCLLNDVSRVRNGTLGAFRMAAQLRVAPHWFLGEAHKLELQAARIPEYLDTAPVPEADTKVYLDGELVSPDRAIFHAPHGEAHIPVLRPMAIVDADRQQLTDAFPVLLEAKNRLGRKRVARRIGNFRPEGCHSVAELMSFLQADWDPR